MEFKIVSVILMGFLCVALCLPLIIYIIEVEISNRKKENKIKYKWEYKQRWVDQKFIDSYETKINGCSGAWIFFYYKDDYAIYIDGYRNNKQIISRALIWGAYIKLNSNEIDPVANFEVDRTIAFDIKSRKKGV